MDERILIDTIPDKIKHNIGSIRITKIDGILQSKVKWNGLTWEEICRYPECPSNIFKIDKTCLCEVHYNEQIRNIVKNKIVNIVI